jgi:hypothetical protein
VLLFSAKKVTDYLTLLPKTILMSIDRLSQLEENLEMLREQKASLEREALLTTGLHKTQAEQRLQREIKPKILEYEQEYWQLLASHTDRLTISEPEAEVAIAEIVENLTQIEAQPSNIYPTEMLVILREIRDKLNRPKPLAAAKLKSIISSIPPFISVSYETELDTESFFLNHFPKFIQWIRGAAKK